MTTKKILRTRLWYVVGAALLAVAAGAAAQQSEEETDPETKARVEKWDRRPSKIDVSKYPAEMKQAYKLYVKKCGKCHTVARAVNCDYVLEREWELYMQRMARRAGSFVSPADSKNLLQFVIYDSKVRKAELYERKLKEGGSTTGGS